MPKIKKKGVSGNAKNFITRTQAVRKLQVSLPDFRRLCIFKGIYPREPRNKKKANKGSTQSTTFYYTKDIQYLLHEPVLQKFRDHKAFAKKLQKALGRGDFSDAKRLETTQKPVIRLDHIVKERYPTFTDALRDLDDALSMIHLFASLPTNENLPPATVANCARLTKEWAHYVIRAGALRKSFLSIKGIYYQAEVGGGQEVLWLVPYSFAQNVPVDVDFRIMHTFVEFYTTLVGFVLFRLYAVEGLVYPPRFDKDADENAGGLGAFSIESRGVAGLFTAGGEEKKRGEEAGERKDVSKQMATLGAKIASLTNEDSPTTTATEPEPEQEGTREDLTIDTFIPATTSSDSLPQPTPSQTTSTSTTLFSNTTFYLSRETPREPLEFLLRSFGCKRIGWDAVLGAGAYTENSGDTSITHQIVDRPPTFPPSAAGDDSTPSTTAAAIGRIPGRIYIQPQYIWDCINAGRLLPPGEYAPGALLPPHLSPWVKPGEGYDPTATLPDVEHSEGEEEEEVEGSDNGMQEDLASDSEPEPVLPLPTTTAAPIEGESSEEEEEDEKDYQRELATEAAGAKLPALSEQDMKKQKKRNKGKMSRQQREEEDQKEMKKIMMSRRKRKLYEKMLYSNAKKESEVEGLKRKRRRLEGGRSKEKKGRRGSEEV
ncbi:Pescadillo N-terminus-domain-containing protein [Tuber brumale]|nr:Pescadillo N-terminus-domain-containing protein [Tuber brumale]